MDILLLDTNLLVIFITYVSMEIKNEKKKISYCTVSCSGSNL